MEKWGSLGLKRLKKNMVLIGNKARGGCALVKAPEEKWGEMVENGETNQSTLAPQFLLFAPTSPHSTSFPPISSHFPPFPPISPHFPPFPPIFPSTGTYRYVAGYITTQLVWVFLRPDPSSCCVPTV